jgi:hypothetical protein
MQVLIGYSLIPEDLHHTVNVVAGMNTTMRLIQLGNRRRNILLVL